MMRICYFVFCFFIFFINCSKSFGQDEKKYMAGKQVIELCPKIDHNISTFHLDQFDEKSVRNWGFGVAIKVPVTQKWSFQPELRYTTRGAELIYPENFVVAGQVLEDAIELDMKYIDVPVMLNYNLSDFFILQAGGYVGMLLDVDAVYEPNPNLKISAFDQGGFQKLDYAVSAGLELNSGPLAIGLRGNYGIATLGNQVDTKKLIPSAKHYWGQISILLILGSGYY